MAKGFNFSSFQKPFVTCSVKFCPKKKPQITTSGKSKSSNNNNNNNNNNNCYYFQRSQHNIQFEGYLKGFDH